MFALRHQLRHVGVVNPNGIMKPSYSRSEREDSPCVGDLGHRTLPETRAVVLPSPCKTVTNASSPRLAEALAARAFPFLLLPRGIFLHVACPNAGFVPGVAELMAQTPWSCARWPRSLVFFIHQWFSRTYSFT